MLKKRSRQILLVILALSLLLLTGCVARPLTVPLILAQTRAALSRQDGATADVLLEGKGEVSYSGMDFSLPLKIKMNTEMTFDPRTIHMKGTAGSSVLGVDLDLPVEYYIRETPEEWTMYSHIEEGAWSKTAAAKQSTGQAGALSAVNLQALADAALYENTTLCEGKECRRIDLTLSRAQIRELLGDAAVPGAADGGAEDDPYLKGSLYIDKETKLPVKISLSAADDVHLMEYSLSGMELEIVFSAWGVPREIKIPEEAVNALDHTTVSPGVFSAILP